MIVLSMIVKDEAETIESTLLSVRPFIDAWVICDTGSTDGTEDVIEEVLGNKVPGLVRHIPFVDFSTTRNEALSQAFTPAFADPDDYVLWLDADDALYGGEHLKDLTGDAHNIDIAQGPCTWESCRVVRAGAGWRFKGEVHEVLSGPQGERAPARIDGVRIVHTPSPKGAERSRARWERDIEILSTKTDPRSTFYLAMTLLWLGRHEAALMMFTRRLRTRGWKEECFLSSFHIATCLAELGNRENAKLWLEVETATEHPARAPEAWYALEGMLRADGDSEKADYFREIRLRVPRPTGALFLDTRAYGPATPVPSKP